MAVPKENVIAALPAAPPARSVPTMELSPMPGACAYGILATKDISSVPMIAPNAVARNTEGQSGLAALKLRI